MDRALWKLLWLRLRAALRRMGRSLKTPRGAVFFAIGVVMVAFWLGPTLVIGVTMNGREAAGARGALSASFRELMPLVMLGFCLVTLLTSSERAVHFSPAEINFLFSGPFSRRQLLLYKLFLIACAALFTAAVFTFFLLQFAALWMAAFVGCFLAILFIQLLNVTVVLVGQTVAERAYTHARRALVVGVVVLAALGMLRSLPSVQRENWMDVTHAFRNSPIGALLLAPFEVFTRVILVETLLPGLVIWGTLALGINLTLVAAVMWLDANYLEASMAASARRYRMIEQARRGGFILAPQRSARWRVPQFPWLMGAGPISWRQLTGALRRARLLIGVLLLLSAAAGPALAIARVPRGVAGPVIGMVMWFTFLMLPRALPFDFRGDVDHLDWLKSLPLRPDAIAVGQLVAPVAIATSLHVAFLGGLAFFVPEYWPLLLAAAAFALPVNVLLFGLENLVFLLFPSRSTAVAPADFQSIGRTMVEFAVKMLILTFCGGLAALVGAAAYFIAARAWAAFAVAAWTVLSLTAALVVPAMVWAYRRFDVSVDTPP